MPLILISPNPQPAEPPTSLDALPPSGPFVIDPETAARLALATALGGMPAMAA